MELDGFKKDRKDPERERNVESYLVREVQKIGGLCKKWICPGTDGVPDRIVIWSGLIEFVELKRPGGKLRPLQQKRHEELKEQGAQVVTLSSRQEVDDYIYRLKSMRGMTFQEGWS